MMNNVADRHRKKEVERSKLMIKLLEDKGFKELILDGFIKDGILEQSLHQGLDSQNTIDQLKARQILNRYIFGIVTTGEILNSH